ncbi:MAG: hypothetical protein KAX56_10795 [Phenylobacterium sp.]|nr:hypothetical protein [Phenylobacterium sp.]
MWREAQRFPTPEDLNSMADHADRIQPADDDQLQERILSTAGAMVGVCATLIGLVKVVEGSRALSHVDQYAGCDAVLFAFSALFAYLAIRTRRGGRARRSFATIADLMFVVGLIALAGIALTFAYDLI